MDEELLARFGGGAELLKELAELFLQGCPKMLEDIRVALHKRDAKALENAAHSLKGSVGNFFSQGACDTAQRLESLGRSGDLTGADELARLLDEQVGEFNRVLARSIESLQQPQLSSKATSKPVKTRGARVVSIVSPVGSTQQVLGSHKLRVKNRRTRRTAYGVMAQQHELVP